MSWTLRRRWLTGLGAIALVTGCFDSGDDGGRGCGSSNGLAGNGDFTYQCIDAADPHCDGLQPMVRDQLPGAIARGASFRLHFSRNGVSGTVHPISSKAVRSNGDELTALRAGSVGFIVRAGAEAVDALRLTIVEPETLSITRAGTSREPLAALALRAKEVATVRAVAVDSDGGVLAGTVGTQWTLEPPEIARIIPQDGTCRIEGRASGEALLTASDGNLRVSVAVRVKDDDALPDAGDLDDAGADASANDDGGNDGGDT